MRATLLLLIGAIGLVALTALTGSSDAVDLFVIQDQLAISSGALDSNAIGQTFTFHKPRLHAIQVAWIVAEDIEYGRDAHVTLHLRARPDDASDLTSASIPLSSIRHNAFSTFTFPPLSDSGNRSYYFTITIPRDAITRGSLALWSSAEDIYPDGSLYVNGAPMERDLAFRAFYEPDLAMLAGALASTSARFGSSVFAVFAILLAAVWLVTRHAPKIFAIALTLGALLAAGVAFLQIRDLAAPLWVDSLSHAQHLQFILEHAQLPSVGFYHFGFHILAALAAKSLTLSLSNALLLVGQLLWVLAGLAVFVLCHRLSGSPLAGLVGAIIIWFLSPTPAYFITWGRYPLILGAVVLPFALLCAIQLIDQTQARVRNIFLAAITFSALAFSQIRLSAFYIAFVAIYLLAAYRGNRGVTVRMASSIFAAISLIVAFLWLGALGLTGIGLGKIVEQNLNQPSIDLETAMDVSMTHHGPALMILAGFSALIGLVRRSRVTLLMLGWLVALAVIALFPPVVGALVPPSLIVLMAFLPAALVIGDAAQFAYERLRSPQRIVQAAAWAVMLIGVSLIGARDMVNIANPATVLFTRADEDAMRWINANVPADSKFLVNSFNWVGSAYMPADGGGWIAYFTNNSIAHLETLADDSESTLLRWIESHSINYVYLGTRAGVLQPSDFFALPERFALVYDREGIKIFRVE